MNARFRIVNNGDYASLQQAKSFPKDMSDKLAASWVRSKWQSIVSFLKSHPNAKHVYGERRGTCAFCHKYSSGGHCGDCPIALRTGRSQCKGTSYYRYHDAKSNAGSLAQAEKMLKLIDKLKV